MSVAFELKVPLEDDWLNLNLAIKTKECVNKRIHTAVAKGEARPEYESVVLIRCGASKGGASAGKAGTIRAAESSDVAFHTEPPIDGRWSLRCSSRWNSTAQRRSDPGCHRCSRQSLLFFALRPVPRLSRPVLPPSLLLIP